MLTEPYRPPGASASHRVRRWDADPVWPGFPADQAGTASATAADGMSPAEEREREPVTVRILADDPVSRDAMLACLRSRPEITVLSGEIDDGTQPPRVVQAARVVLVLSEWITDETLTRMREAAEAAPGAGFVLVGDGLREYHLLAALTHGPLSVIARRDADADRVARAIVGVPQGRLELPPDAVGWLVTRLRTIHRDVLEPRGLTAAGLGTREVEVLRLLAEGLDTAEIAERMSYSERTVKSIIHGVLTRCRLKNRAHAVAFALRSGAL